MKIIGDNPLLCLHSTSANMDDSGECFRSMSPKVRSLESSVVVRKRHIVLWEG